MRRITGLTILIVVLSTLLNLAIALGFWWFGERPPTPSEQIDSGEFGIVDMRPQEVALWRKRRGPDWPDEPRAVTRQNYLGITFRSMVWIQIEWSGYGYSVVSFDRASSSKPTMSAKTMTSLPS